MDSKISIKVEELTKKYGDFAAVDDISFAVSEGEFFGFLGPNGAGKSTTMRILSTLIPKTHGKVSVNGHDLDTDAGGIRRSIGFAMQNISLDNAASGYENLELLGVLYGLSPKAARARAEELVELVGLKKVAEAWVSSYSGGMRRRLDLAGVLMHRPQILFLDEPTEGLDPQARRLIWDYLRELNQQGTTIFLTTHYMEEADALCRRLAFIDHGKIILEGEPKQLKGQLGGDVVTLQLPDNTNPSDTLTVIKKALPNLKDLRLEGDHTVLFTLEKAETQIASLITTLDKAKITPTALNVAQPTLEDLFVHLIGHSILEEDSTSLKKGVDPFIQGRVG